MCTGVKRPTLDNLIPNKTYFFFSHTIKAQPENMDLLDAALEKVRIALELASTASQARLVTEESLVANTGGVRCTNLRCSFYSGWLLY